MKVMPIEESKGLRQRDKQNADAPFQVICSGCNRRQRVFPHEHEWKIYGERFESAEVVCTNCHNVLNILADPVLNSYGFFVSL